MTFDSNQFDADVKRRRTIYMDKAGVDSTLRLHHEKKMKAVSEHLAAGGDVALSWPVARCDDELRIEVLRAAYTRNGNKADAAAEAYGWRGVHDLLDLEFGVIPACHPRGIGLGTFLAYLSSLFGQKPTETSMDALESIANRHDLWENVE